jgi:hypothetical protein
MAFQTTPGGVHLSTQQFGEVVEAMRVEAACNRHHERRMATRIEIHTTIQIAHCPNGLPQDDITVLTRDISIGGIGLEVAYAIAHNELLLLRLPRLNRGALVMLGRCTFSRPLADQIYSVGVSFIREFSQPAGSPEARADLLRSIQQRILA